MRVMVMAVMVAS